MESIRSIAGGEFFSDWEGEIFLTEQEAELKRLNVFLDATLPQAISLYVDLFINQQDAVSDEELGAATANGFEELIQRWNAEYTDFAYNQLIPMWKDALKAGATDIEQEFSIELNLETLEMQKWLNSRARNFINTATKNLETVLNSTLKKCRARNFSATQTAYALRPMIGLNPKQAIANWKFQCTFVKYISNPPKDRKLPPLNKRSISNDIQDLRDKLEAALNYSLEQIKYYARFLAEKNWVEEYNKGKYDIMQQAIKFGLIGACEKIWVTANDEKVCRDCWLMSGAVAAFNEKFHDFHGKTLGLFPPLHPHCRCVVFYHRLLPPGLNDLTPAAMSTPNTSPYLLGRIDPNDGQWLAAVLRHYEELIVEQPIENAIIITADGEVYHATGDLNSVDPVVELGSKLNGATVTHNHPKDSAGDYSFSDEDKNLFTDYGLERLRGIDEYYVYEINRNPDDIDDGDFDIEEMMTGHNYVHYEFIKKAKELGIGYRRWKHE